MTEPLILTLQLDEASQAFYETLRQRHFPSERNFIPAHLTLFHQLPDAGATQHTLHQTAQSTAVFQLLDPTPRSIGRGVAVFFESKPLSSLHKTLSSAFEPHITPQDAQTLRPHIVVQNKVDPAAAKQTLAELQPQPLIAPQAIGLSLWRYLGGPWQHLADFPFGRQSLE